MRGYLIGTTAAIALMASGAAYAQNAEEHGQHPGGAPHAQEHAPGGAPGGEHRAATPAAPHAAEPRAAEAPVKAEPRREVQAPAAVEHERGKAAEAPRAEPKREAQTPAARETEKRAETPARENKAEPKREAQTPNAEPQKTEAKGEPRREAETPAAREDSKRADGPARDERAAQVHVDRSKQTRISSVIEREHVEKLTDVDFNVRVGRLVPPRHHFYPLPEEIVTLVPEYRGYDYIVADDDIVIVDPDTRRIVYTMQEGRSSSMDRRATDCQ